MKTQIKILNVTELDKIEATVNLWLESQKEIEVQNLAIWPLITQEKSIMLVMIIYSKEEWR
jgi:hypothetical protein